MNQTARVLSVYGSFLRGAGQHLTFYECVADLVENGGSIEDVTELVREAKKRRNRPHLLPKGGDG